MHITKILSFIVTMTLLLFSCIKDDESETINYINVKSQIPTFAVEDTAGNTFSSKQFIGKQSLLVFFGTYCPDCKQVLPVIEEVWKELKDDPKFLLVTISGKKQPKLFPITGKRINSQCHSTWIPAVRFSPSSPTIRFPGYILSIRITKSSGWLLSLWIFQQKN